MHPGSTALSHASPCPLCHAHAPRARLPACLPVGIPVFAVWWQQNKLKAA